MIFTKFDRLVGMEMRKAGFQPRSNIAKDQFNMAKKRANTRFLRECIFPFHALVGRVIPYLPISSTPTIFYATPASYAYLLCAAYPQYQASLSELINLTFASVEQYCREAAVVMGISQKVNTSVKIRICMK